MFVQFRLVANSSLGVCSLNVAPPGHLASADELPHFIASRATGILALAPPGERFRL
jgi:hypothetical protein